MFYDTSRFPFVEKLESSWASVLTEYIQLKTGTIPYFEHDLYKGEWDVFPLLAFGEKDEERCKLCPKTWDLVKDIPGLTTAAFSILRAYTEIHPHTGFTNKVLRCHLGLNVPHGCAIIVGDQARRWEEGKCLIFDDTVEHSAYNKNDEDRVVLLLDFKRDEFESILTAED
jgi:aspartyl/asparaginyl beta-hydroxylase (cupin superfamily)